MAGHSKWAQIKRKKAANDAARAKEFTKVTRLITFAAQKGGGDPDNNPTLALAISRAKEINMPKENIEKAIKKAIGELDEQGNRYEEITYEGYGPGNVSILIDCMTNNKKRTFTEIRTLVEKLGGMLTSPGTISWQFKTKGRILFEYDLQEKSEKEVRNVSQSQSNLQKLKKENFEQIALELIDIPGIEDLSFDEIGLEIITDPTKLNEIRKIIESKNYLISETSIVKIPTNKIKLDSESLDKFNNFLQKLEEVEDIQNIWHNLDDS